MRESEEEARLREEGVDDVESIGVDPLDERYHHFDAPDDDHDDHDDDHDIDGYYEQHPT